MPRWLDALGTGPRCYDHLGSGDYPAGNPNAGLSSGGGGGVGCHFDNGVIDQTNAIDGNNENLVQDENCQCNYNFREDWGKWVDNWLNIGIGGKSPSWAVDIAACWVNNIRDMIKIQNAIYWRRQDWNDQQVPEVSYGPEAWSNRNYWGWNEIPMDRKQVGDQTNWDAVVVKIPTGSCSDDGSSDALDCFDKKYWDQLERDLDNFVQHGYLGLGAGAQDLDAEASSNVVLVREFIDGSGNYFRQFFCEDWTSPSGKYQIVFKEGEEGGCYLDHGPDGNDSVSFV